MTNTTQYEAVFFEEITDRNGEVRNIRHKVGNVVPSKTGDSFTLYIPPQMAITGAVTIQPKRERSESEPAAA